jgi:hypothetical protein
VVPESRELRLLLVTIGASFAVLVGLARLRFPAAGPAAPPSQLLPIDRLGPQALYEDLVRAVDRLESRLGPHLVERAGEDGRPALALLWNSTQAIAWSPLPERASDARILAVDRGRGLLLLRHAASPASPALAEWAPEAAGPIYLAAAEAGPGGWALRPVFVGRLRATHSATWGGVLAVSGASLTPGSFLFTLDGHRLGLVVPDAGGAAVLSGSNLRAHAESLARDPRGAAWSGVRLGRLPGEARGALVVLSVEEWSRWAERLRAGDALETAGGSEPASAVEAEDALRSATAVVRVRRGGARLQVRPAGEPSAPGLRLADTPGGARVVAVAPDSPAARAGLHVGDRLAAFDGVEAPTPADVARRYGAARRGARLVVVVGHGREARPLLLEKP